MAGSSQDFSSATIGAFSLAFSSTLQELTKSLATEGDIFEGMRSLLASLRHRSAELERMQENSQEDGALIVSLRKRLAESAGVVEALEVRGEHQREELARGCAALGGAQARIRELVGEVETLRQMLVAAPRPSRPQLGVSRAASSATASSSSSSSSTHTAPSGGGARATATPSALPFELWRADKGLVRLVEAPVPPPGRGGGGAGLPQSFYHALGHACATPATQGCCEGGQGGGGGGGGAPEPLGRGSVELVEHPFWSPHLYPSSAGPPPPEPQHQQHQRAKLREGGKWEAHFAPLPGAPPPPRLFPLTLTHVSNLDRNGCEADKWKEELRFEQHRVAATQQRIGEREGRLASLRQFAQELGKGLHCK